MIKKDLLGNITDGQLLEMGPGSIHEGSLALVGLHASTLPEDLIVKGDLIIKDCADFEFLPRDLFVTGTLALVNCPRFHSLGEPDGKSPFIGASLYIKDCPVLEFLPSRLTVPGNFSLLGVSLVSDVPSSLNLSRDIIFSECHGLTKLPDGFTSKRRLVINDCHNLETLPQRLQVADDLVVIDCQNFRELPADLYVGKDLEITRTSITSTPDGLRVPSGKLCLQDNMDLNELGRDLQVGTNLFLYGSPLITHLPDDMTVGGKTYIYDCPGLQDTGLRR